MYRKITFTILFLFILTFSLPVVFAQEQPLEQISPAQDNKDAPSAPAPEQQEVSPAKLVTAIEIQGNKAISTNTVISKMRSKIGSPYQENVISDDLKRLYLLGYFSDIKIDTQDYKDGIKIIVTVQERPIIDKINFTGILHITLRDEKIKESLKSKESQYLDYPSLGEDVQILKKMYEKIGFNQAYIDYKVDVDKEKNRAKVTFNIVEGKRVKIRRIVIEGNTTFPARRILRLMKTKQAWLFNAGVLRDEVLKEDIERIKSFYGREGFSDATVKYDVKPDKKPFLLKIVITVKEGKRYLVGNVTIEGNKEISQKEILAKLKESVPGKVFSQEALKQDIANIQALYFDRGFITVQVQEATSLNTYTGRIDIVYTIVENEIVYVNKIKVRGNIKTRDIVIRRELRIMPGDKFDGAKLKRSKERLQNLGFFEEVNYDTEDTPEPDKKNLVVEVKESKTGAFSFGGGYSTVDQFVGFVEVEQKNFDWRNFPYFTGAGQNLVFKASFGSVSQGFDLSFTEPWLFDYPVSFGFDGYQREHKRDSDIGYGYDEKITGGDLRLGKEISEYVRADLMYRFDSIRIGSVTENATYDLKKEVGTNGISSLQFGMSYDSRNNIFDTTKGNLFSANIENAGGFIGGDKNYYKFSGRASHYLPLLRNSVLEFRLRMGLGDTYGDSDGIPIYERFFAGGSNTIRGYHERKVGPIDPISKDPLGGNSLLVGNLEYLYPLFNFLKVAAFYDIGNVWARTSQIGTSGLKAGFGFGVRVKTPIGPVMLDYGIPLNTEPGEEKRGGGRFHFNVSRGF